MHRLIERNTTIPTKRSEVFTRPRTTNLRRDHVLQVSGRWPTTTSARQVPAGRPAPGPVGCPDRGQFDIDATASSSRRPDRARQHAVDDDHRPVLTGQGRHRAHGARRRVHAEETAAAATRQSPQHGRHPRLPDEKLLKDQATSSKEREGGRDVCLGAVRGGTCGHGHRGHQDGHESW